MARIDMNGDGAEESEDSLTALGFTHEERTVLGGKYAAGASAMRALTTSFSPIDLNFPIIVDPDISPEDDPEDEVKDSSNARKGVKLV
ncbi:MAG: hypothetical protein IPN71_13130 [Fibrobacteres bacterium]|nr:hypothetical protein [Fibrobacterota bacterium]